MARFFCGHFCCHGLRGSAFLNVPPKYANGDYDGTIMLSTFACYAYFVVFAKTLFRVFSAW